MTEDAILRPPSSSPNITFSFSFRLYISQVPSVWHLHSYLTHSAISPLVPPVLSYFIFSPYVHPLLSIKHLRHDRGPDSMKHSIRGVSEEAILCVHSLQSLFYFTNIHIYIPNKAVFFKLWGTSLQSGQRNSKE